MKFSENWLRTFVTPPLTSAELADALTMGGIEVEAMERAAPAFERVVVAEVLDVRESIRTRIASRVCSVNAGGAPLQVVCGRRTCAREYASRSRKPARNCPA